MTKPGNERYTKLADVDFAKLPKEEIARLRGDIIKRRPKWGEPGSKSTRRTGKTVWSGGKHRAVLLTVYPDGTVGYRLLGLRREYFRNAADDYRDAVRATVAAERAAKKKARKS